jgi:hypothetical protein
VAASPEDDRVFRDGLDAQELSLPEAVGPRDKRLDDEDAPVRQVARA